MAYKAKMRKPSNLYNDWFLKSGSAESGRGLVNSDHPVPL